MIYKDPVLLVLIDIMSFWYLVERPDGFFLECSSSFTYPDVLPHVKAVDKELMVEMLTKGYITYITHLSIDEFEVQRALGVATYMSTFQLTALGYAQAMADLMYAPDDALDFTYTTSTGEIK